MTRPALTARRIHALAAIIALALLMVGCSSKTVLIPTPTLNLTQGAQTFAAVPPEARTPEMEILYAADRSVIRETVLGIEFGTGRSGVLTVGTAKIGFDRAVSWDQLVKLSTTDDAYARRPAMQMKSVSEFGVIAVPLAQMEVRDGRYVLTDASKKQIDDGRAKLHEVLAERLAHPPRKDVYIFVHGFNNNFNDAVFRLGTAWHMAGRPGVAIAYTWPAGRGGLHGYAYDRDRGSSPSRTCGGFSARSPTARKSSAST